MTDMYGDDNQDKRRVDMVLDCVVDIRQDLISTVWFADKSKQVCITSKNLDF